MKNYIERLSQSCPKAVYALWWVLRILTLYAFAENIISDNADITFAIRSLVGFVCMFLWEFFMAMPEKSFVRKLPSFLQTIITVSIFISVFVGHYLGLYSSVAVSQMVSQFLFGVVSVFICYEIACAFIKKEKYYATKAMAFFAAFGLFFISLNLVELSEFFIDQLVGVITGEPSNSQHWSYELAKDDGAVFQFIPAVSNGRIALMGIMNDIILSTAGAFSGLIVVNIFPYRHKGKYKYNFDFGKGETPAKHPEKQQGSVFKNYYNRLKNNGSKRTYLFWWVFRIIMLGMMIYAFITEPEDSIIPVEILMNFCCMFVWELCMAMPRKTVFRYVNPGMQTIIIIAVFIAVIAGYLFNSYYELRFWDSALHFLCGIGIVFFGYEMTFALFKLESKTAPFSLVLITSVGFCFMCTTFWEIFEFSCDQVVGIYSGVAGDVQHWSYEKALGTAKIETLFNPINLERWPIMDTMGDIVLNTIGSIIGVITLKIYPYRHKGKHKFNFDFE